MVTRERKKLRDEEDEMSMESDQTNYGTKEAMRKARGQDSPRPRPRQENKREPALPQIKGALLLSAVLRLYFVFCFFES